VTEAQSNCSRGQLHALDYAMRSGYDNGIGNDDHLRDGTFDSTLE
jgi:hypothetical protein